MVLGSSLFSILSHLPQKTTLNLKVVKFDMKIIISICWSKSATHSVAEKNCLILAFQQCCWITKYFVSCFFIFSNIFGYRRIWLYVTCDDKVLKYGNRKCGNRFKHMAIGFYKRVVGTYRLSQTWQYHFGWGDRLLKVWQSICVSKKISLMFLTQMLKHN